MFMTTAYRLFKIDDDGRIEESRGNREEQIYNSKQDYWILQYAHGKVNAFAALLPLRAE
jgi:hypothetical protein